jgi:hypothetical protein
VSHQALTDEQVDRFIEDGFTHLEEVVSPQVVASGRNAIWDDLKESPHEPTSWTRPVVRLLPSDAAPFKAAFENARLSTALDQLVGARRWQPRPDLGLFVVRFPHRGDPGDTGWHIDSSFAPDDVVTEDFDFSHWRVNVTSRGRVLLMLFLFSDVGPDDAPTRIRVGSHSDVPPILLPAGHDGMDGTAVAGLAADASRSRPVALATGAAGDVYLCHPFLVHAAQPMRGTTPRFMAQPPLAEKEPLRLERPDGAYSPVEVAIRRGLASPVDPADSVGRT